MIYRVHKNDNYTVMANYHFRDKKLSLKAKGLLSMMLSLPDTWSYSVEGLVSLSRDGRDAVRNAIQELEERGYIVRTRLKDDNGSFGGMQYDVYEFPVNGIPTLDNPTLDKGPLSNTKESNTKESNTKDIDMDAQVEMIITEWNKLKKVSGNLQRIIPMSKRWNDTFYTVGQYSFDEFISTIHKIDSMAFTEWMPSYDWFCNLNNFTKVYEGNFDKPFRENNQASEDWIKGWLDE